ncbi:Por secretion system C-terminal sorting domain-containing protein [Cyclonatronum proteinivorum]|uniref:Por secretion system C-terminal sorting domain-containing protein n=1 Tax=Cyclonatronum proteinivorum TaxID=1457365 RepID=A0A345UN07_9BACT|nr:CotH kinase family protein [Cyclonatronum proteinivorum]AXJ01859.1 Por secretion system C-terminal sorting domain-containing protein [Cyclonatronum proteinivorum]
MPSRRNDFECPHLPVSTVPSTMRHVRKLTLLLTLILGISLSTAPLDGMNAQAQAQGLVVINEFQASNQNTIADEDGDYEDWIELHNPGTAPISLGGFGLSDNDGNPFKWILPDVSIPAGGYLLVWASGKDRSNPGGELHTNFSISASGEPLLITRPNGSTADFIPAQQLYPDISYGRLPAGSGFGFFATPTPGSSNTTTAYAGITPQPEFSQPGGFITGPVSLSLSLESPPETRNGDAGRGTIRYTLSHNKPGEGEDTAVYDTPLTIDGTRIVRATAQWPDYLPSEPVTEIFTRITPAVEAFSSNLPVMVMHEHGTEVTPGDRSPVSYLMLEPGSDGRARFSSPPAIQSRGVANIRGNSSQMFPKKMFGFHLYDDFDRSRNEALFGMPADHNWILYAPYSDKSLMRNVISYHLGAELHGYAPRTRFVELFLNPGNGALNDGHYHGVYVLTERIKWGEGRVDIPVPGRDNSDPGALTGGYIFKKDRLNEGDSGFTTQRGTMFAFVRPQERDMTPARTDYLRNYLSSFESALYGNDFTDPATGYRAWIDTETFIDHFILTELLKEIDGYRLSTYFTKNRHEKLRMGPLWDFNLSLGNANYLTGENPEGWYYTEPSNGNHCYIGCGVRDWYVRMLEDPAFDAQLRQRWQMHRQNQLSEDYLNELISSLQDELQEAQARNFIRWPILGQYVWPNYFVAETWEEELEWMRDWLMTRLAWIDEQLDDDSEPKEARLANFFFFGEQLPNNTPLEEIGNRYAAFDVAHLTFESALSGYPFISDHPDWRRAALERRNRPTDLNYRERGNAHIPFDDADMRGIQVRQPFAGDGGENALILHLPASETGGLILSFAAMDEGAAEYLDISYSVANGEPVWRTDGLNQHKLPLQDSYQLYTIDLGLIEEANQNPDFKVRIGFGGTDMSVDDGNRVTFNNIAFEYRLNGSDFVNLPEEQPRALQLMQNYPNPFNNNTIFEFTIPSQGFTELSVYTVLGQRVAVAVSDVLPSGTYRIPFNATGLASGVYLYRLTHNDRSVSRKFLLLK